MVDRQIWGVIYKNRNSNKWKDLEGKSRFWYADPMLIEYNGEVLMFVEAFDMLRQIGTIAVSVYQNGRFLSPIQIIKSSYHMSYPCVFLYEGVLYMIPETSQNGTIELWKSVGSPFEWKKEKNLCEGVVCVDSTVVKEENTLFVVSYSQQKPWITYLFELDMNKKELNQLSQFQSEINNSRPAGYCYTDDQGILHRPVQNCQNCYGESIIVKTVKSIAYMDERKEKEIFASDLDHADLHYSRTHTISQCNGIQVFDVMKDIYVPWFFCHEGFRKIRNVLFRTRFHIKYGKRKKQ